MVGSAPPPAPSLFGHGRRPPFAPYVQFLVVPHRLDPRRGLRRDQLAVRSGLEPISGASLAEPKPLAARPGCSRRMPGRWRLERPCLGILPEHRPGLPRDLPGKLAIPRLGA